MSEASKKMTALISTIRVVSITATAFNKNKILSQAASLSYTSLLAIGPLIALLVLCSSVFLKNQGSEYVYQQVVSIIEFALPALSEMPSGENGDASMSLSPQIIDFLNNITKTSASLGVFGTLSVIVTCILLCATMENAFNFLWNVKTPRKWISRIVFYWALISLGSVVGIFGMTFLASSQLSSIFKDVPYFEHFEGGSTFLMGFGALSLLLSFAYKFLPNANVRFLPALCGGIFATAALMLNNKLSFLYIGMVVDKQNFYGYLAVLPLALFSLYVFWVLVLVGAQVSFSVQNVDSLSSRFMWNKLSNRTKNLVCLAIFSNISKKFLKEEIPPTEEKLCTELKLSKPLVSYCIYELLEVNLLSKIEDPKDKIFTYKPAISPSNITLAGFFDRLNVIKEHDDEIAKKLSQSENSIKKALDSFSEYQGSKLASTPIKDIL